MIIYIEYNMTGVFKSLLKGNESPLAIYCAKRRLINVIIIVFSNVCGTLRL